MAFGPRPLFVSPIINAVLKIPPLPVGKTNTLPDKSFPYQSGISCLLVTVALMGSRHIPPTSNIKLRAFSVTKASPSTVPPMPLCLDLRVIVSPMILHLYLSAYGGIYNCFQRGQQGYLNFLLSHSITIL